MTNSSVEPSRIRDVVPDSKIRLDIPLKPNLKFDSSVAETDRNSGGLRHNLYCDTQLVDGVFPHVHMAEVGRCCYQGKDTVRERNRSWFRTILPTFDGSPIIEEFYEWVDSIEDYFEETQPPERLKCKLASYTLENEAESWWLRLQHDRVDSGKLKIYSWTRMKRMLAMEFLHYRCSIKVPSEYKGVYVHSQKPKQFSAIDIISSQRPSSFTITKQKGQTSDINYGGNDEEERKNGCKYVAVAHNNELATKRIENFTPTRCLTECLNESCIDRQPGDAECEISCPLKANDGQKSEDYKFYEEQETEKNNDEKGGSTNVNIAAGVEIAALTLSYSESSVVEKKYTDKLTEDEAETGDQPDAMLGELKKCAIEGQKGGVVHEAKTDSCKVKDCDLQETPDLNVVKLKWKCTTVYKCNSQPPIGATMSPYLSQKWSIGSIYDVEVKGQTWESQKDGTATESVVRLQPNSLMPKAGLCEVDDYMKLTYLVFGSTLLRVKRLSDAKFMTGVIPLTSFDPGGKGRNRTKTIYGHEMGQGNVLTVAPSCLGNTGIHKVGNAKEEQSRIRLLNESDFMNGGTLYSSFDPGGHGINEARKCSSKPVMANVHFQALNHSLERLPEEFANINVHAFLSFDPGGIIYSLKTWNSVSCPRSKTCILFVVNMHTGDKASDMPCSKSCMLGTMKAILYIGYNEASEAMSIIPKQLFDPSMVSSPCFYDVISESKLFVRMMNEMFHVIGGVDWRTYYCYVTDRRNNLHFLESVYELMHLGPEDFESLRDLKGYGYCSTKMAPQVDQLIPIEFYGLFLVYAEQFTELCDAFMFKPALRKMISIQVQFVRKEMLGPRDYIGLHKEHAHMCEFVEVGTVRNGTSQLWMLHSWYETYIKLVVLLFDPGGSTYSSNTWSFKNCIFSCSNMIDGSIEDSSNLKVKASLTTHGDDIDSLAIASNVCHVFQMKLDIFVDLCKTNNVGGTFDQSASGLIVHEHGMDILPAYAFGVVLIDFLSDENPIENIYRKGFEILVYWAETSLKEGKAGDVGMFTFDPGGRDSDTLKGQLQSLFYLCLESRKLICMQKDTSLNLNDENDFNTRGMFTIARLSVGTFTSCLSILHDDGHLKKALKLFFKLVNGLDPPLPASWKPCNSFNAAKPYLIKPDDASTAREQLEDEFVLLERDGDDADT